MKSNILNVSALLCVFAAMLAQPTLAQPSSKVCDDDGGPEICVRFDNVSGAPEEDTHFEFTFDGSGIPTVNLFIGDDGQGTTYEWRVWSWVSEQTQTPQDIGQLTAGGAFDYEVTLLQPDDDSGADNVALIDLDPSDDAKYSNLTGGQIAGDLSGDLFVRESSGSTGGSLSLTIGGDLSGSIDVGDVTGTMTVAGDFVAGHTFDADDISGSLSIEGNAYGFVTLMEFTGSVDVTGDVDFYWFIVWGDGSGDITGGAVTSALVLLAYGEGNAYSGTATFSSVASDGLVETMYAPLSGTINVIGNVAGTVRAGSTGSAAGLTETGVIDINGDVSGTPGSVSATYAEGVSAHSPGLPPSGYPGNVNIGFPVRPHRGRAQRTACFSPIRTARQTQCGVCAAALSVHLGM